MVGDDLTARMVATLALVLVIDLAFALVLVALLEPWLAPLLAGFGIGSTLGRYALLIALVLAGLVWAKLRYTRQELLAEADAEPITAESHPDLYARVTRLSTLADLRVPTVAVADTDVPNSFAVGGLRSGTVVVSEGLLETLADDELDAVLAHELVHLANRDAVVMTLASFLPALVADEYSPLEEALPDGTKPLFWGALAAGCYVLAATALGVPIVSLEGLVQFGIAAAVAVLLGGVALGLLATPVVFLSRGLSRQREFVADRGGARLVGDPAALASALTTLDEVATPPSEDARVRYRGLDGMCLLPHGFDDEVDAGDGFHVETRSHPPTAERIARLRELAASLES